MTQHLPHQVSISKTVATRSLQGLHQNLRNCVTAFIVHAGGYFLGSAHHVILTKHRTRHMLHSWYAIDTPFNPQLLTLSY